MKLVDRSLIGLMILCVVCIVGGLLLIGCMVVDMACGSDQVITSGVVDSKEYVPNSGHGEFRVSVKRDDVYHIAQMKTEDWLAVNVGDRAIVTQRRGKFFYAALWAVRDTP